MQCNNSPCALILLSRSVNAAHGAQPGCSTHFLCKITQRWRKPHLQVDWYWGSWMASQMAILLMRTRKNPLRTRKTPLRTRKTPLRTRQTPLSKKKLPWPRSVMNIGKGMYTFNITEIKKRTSKWIIKINKKHTWDKFVKNFV